jgi:hypothetical protein
MAHRVDRLPGDQHRHDGGLAGAGRELQRNAQQLRIRLLVGAADVRPDPGARRRTVRGDLGEPDRGLDRLDLAEKRLEVIELMMAPMLKEAGGFRGHLPLVGVRQVAPRRDVTANFVDDRGRVVLLLLCGKPVAGAETQFALARRASPPLRLRHRGDQFRAPAAPDDAIGRLAILVEFPMPGGMRVGRVEDRPLEKTLVHPPLP